MTKKIELDDVQSGFNLSKINSNFQTIEDTLNDRVLFRTNTVGTPNQLESNIDANDKRIYNLPKPVNGSEPLRLKDLFGDVDELLQGPAAQHFTTQAGQQVFTLVTQYVPGTQSLRVYRNGVFLIDSEYQEISNQQVRILEPLDTGDIISIVPVAVAGGGSVQETAGANVGTGVEVYKDKTGDLLNFRTLVPGSNVSITENNNEIIISSSAAGGGSGTITASNIGTGQDVFSAKVGDDLQFKRIRAGTNMTVATDAAGIVVSTTSELNTASNLAGTGEGVFASKSGSDLRFKRIRAGSGVSVSSDSTGVIISSTGAGNSIYANVKDFGAIGDGVADDTAAIQDTINYANPLGLTVFLPAGKYKISSGLTISNTTDSVAFDFKASMMGEGSAATSIIATSGNYDMLTILGGSGAGVQSHQTIKGIFFQRSDATRACISGDNLAFIRMDDVTCYGADVGIALTDILSSLFENCIIRFNNKGLRFERSNFSYPNAITLNQCVIGNNNTYGIWAIGGTTLSMHGGSVEGNGTTIGSVANWGVLLSNSGYEGAVAGAFHGTYFENNSGRADVWLANSLNSVATSFTGCTFNRIQASRYVTNNIYVETSGSGVKQTVSVMGCGFKGFNDYVPNGGRLYIASVASGGSTNSVAWAGCMFASATEAPTMTNEISGGTPPVVESVFAYGLAPSAGGISAGSKYKNISSIVRNGVGDYTWNFSTPSSVINPPVTTGVFGDNTIEMFQLSSTYVRLFTRSRATGALSDAVHSIMVF